MLSMVLLVLLLLLVAASVRKINKTANFIALNVYAQIASRFACSLSPYRISENAGEARRMMPGRSTQPGQQTVLLWQHEGRQHSALPLHLFGFISLQLTIGTDFAWRAAQHSKVFSAQGVK